MATQTKPKTTAKAKGKGPTGPPRLTDENKAILASLGLPVSNSRPNRTLAAISEAFDTTDFPMFFLPKDVTLPSVIENDSAINVVKLDTGRQSIVGAMREFFDPESGHPGVTFFAYRGGFLVVTSAAAQD